jgi:DNA excision repair protein ERCC-3
VKLEKSGDGLVLVCDDIFIAAEIEQSKKVMSFCHSKTGDLAFAVNPIYRGHIKQALINIEYPAEDLAGYSDSTKLSFTLRTETVGGYDFSLRAYQQESAEVFHADGSARGGNGVIVLPCGSGKTIVALAVMEKLQCETLILTTSISAVRQFITELIDKTTITEDQIGEFSGEHKDIRPITVSTYQILSSRSKAPKADEGNGLDDDDDNDDSLSPYFALMNGRNWGLIIYDEVHTLPAPVFRMTAELQSRRRLGLTATLVREDNLQSDVFTLIGPKRYEVGWKVMEQKGFIAKAECFEVRVPLDDSLRMQYAIAPKRDKFRIAAENPGKTAVLMGLLKKHEGCHILIIGQYLDQLNTLAAQLNVPIITGKLPTKKRDELYAQFRYGEIQVMVVSKVSNYAIDLPDANVAIEISGAFGSRQEEAQRLGRILRPKAGENRAWFYMLCTRDTVEQGFAEHRQLFLTEQGYPYAVVDG